MQRCLQKGGRVRKRRERKERKRRERNDRKRRERNGRKRRKWNGRKRTESKEGRSSRGRKEAPALSPLSPLPRE